MQSRVNIHIEGEDNDILNGTTLSLPLLMPLTAEYLARRLLQWLYETHRAYKINTILPNYIQPGYSHSHDIELMRILMVHLSRNVEPDDMALTIYKYTSIDSDSKDYERILRLMINDIINKSVFETEVTTSPFDDNIVDIKWRSPHVSMLFPYSMNYERETMAWNNWWETYFDTLGHYYKDRTSQRHKPQHRPQISEEALLTFLAQ